MGKRREWNPDPARRIVIRDWRGREIVPDPIPPAETVHFKGCDEEDVAMAKWVGVCDAPAGGCGFGKRMARIYESQVVPEHGEVAEGAARCGCGSQLRRVSARTEARVLKDETVPVIFRVWPKEHNAVIAILPTLPGTFSPLTCSSYMHVGQHGACDPAGMIAETRPARPEEYADLKKELEAAPYHYILEVRQRLARAYRKARERAIKETR